MKKINVELYGGKSLFGGRETPLEADIIYCDCSENCSFYRDNKCLNCRSFLGATCKKGKVETIKGYTSRAKKYSEFRARYKNDNEYGRLNYPSDLAALIDDELWLNLQFVHVRKAKKDDSKWQINEFGYIITDGAMLSNILLLPLSDLNIELLNRIFSFIPYAIMGGEIKKYQNTTVPNIINQLKIIVPDIYYKLIQKYPKYNIKPNYIGKYAYVRTMTNGSILTDAHGNKAVLKDGKLYCESFTKGFVPFRGKNANCIIDIDEKQTYKITDNSQCDENTKFQ